MKRTGFAWERLSHFLAASAVPWRVWGTLLFLFMCWGSSEFRWVCSRPFSAKDAFGKVLRFPALWAYYWRKRYCFFFFFFWFKVLRLPLDILQISAESNLRNFWSLLVSPLKEKRKKGNFHMKLGIILQPCCTENLVSSCQSLGVTPWEELSSCAPEMGGARGLDPG